MAIAESFPLIQIDRCLSLSFWVTSYLQLVAECTDLMEPPPPQLQVGRCPIVALV